jgi:hypothetical protein
MLPVIDASHMDVIHAARATTRDGGRFKDCDVRTQFFE